MHNTRTIMAFCNKTARIGTEYQLINMPTSLNDHEIAKALADKGMCDSYFLKKVFTNTTVDTYAAPDGTLRELRKTGRHEYPERAWGDKNRALSLMQQGYFDKQPTHDGLEYLSGLANREFSFNQPSNESFYILSFH